MSVSHTILEVLPLLSDMTKVSKETVPAMVLPPDGTNVFTAPT
jgi:hypothetical protein